MKSFRINEFYSGYHRKKSIINNANIKTKTPKEDTLISNVGIKLTQGRKLRK